MLERQPIYSVRDFAKLAGVSTATISRVFADSACVAPETRDRVRALAEQHGFRPNRASGASFGARTHSVGVILCQLTTSFFADIAVGIQKTLLAEDYLPIMIDLRADTERAGIRRLLDHRVDGLILSIADQTLTDSELAELNRFHVPVVMVDRDPSESPYDSVSSDDERGGRLAGEHLLSLGHRQIGYCYVGAPHSTARARQTGLTQALAAAGGELRPQDTISVFSPQTNQTEGLARLLAARLRQPDRPSAFYGYNDHCARAVYQAAAQIGLRIPRDLSVVGHADLNFAAVMAPPLTTLRQDGEAVGRAVAALMLERLHHSGEIPLPARHQTLPVELIVRESTCPHGEA